MQTEGEAGEEEINNKKTTQQQQQHIRIIREQQHKEKTERQKTNNITDGEKDRPAGRKEERQSRKRDSQREQT